MSDHTGIFPGFPPEPVTNYWPYPKALNGWWHMLSGNEQKCLDYILRHTWGYKKDADAISHFQFIHGIKKRDGTIVDMGTGIKDEKTVRRSLKRLSDKGFIEIIIAQNGGLNIYKLKITPSQNLVPLPTSNPPPLPKFGSTSSQDMVPTIKDITIKDNNNISASQTIKNTSYKENIISLISHLSTKLGGIQFPNYGKQAKYAKSILDVGYLPEEVFWTIDKMMVDKWWSEHTFDMKNVADQIPKFVANKKMHGVPKPQFIACGTNSCDGGYVYNKENNSMALCKCRRTYEEQSNP